MKSIWNFPHLPMGVIIWPERRTFAIVVMTKIGEFLLFDNCQIAIKPQLSSQLDFKVLSLEMTWSSQKSSSALRLKSGSWYIFFQIQDLTKPRSDQNPVTVCYLEASGTSCYYHRNRASSTTCICSIAQHWLVQHVTTETIVTRQE